MEQVADYYAHPDNAPEWYVNIKSAEWKTQRPLTVGSQVSFVTHFLGRKLAYTYEFVTLIPHGSVVMRTAEELFPMELTNTWTAINTNATRMTFQNRSGYSIVY